MDCSLAFPSCRSSPRCTNAQVRIASSSAAARELSRFTFPSAPQPPHPTGPPCCECVWNATFQQMRSVFLNDHLCVPRAPDSEHPGGEAAQAGLVMDAAARRREARDRRQADAQGSAKRQRRVHVEQPAAPPRRVPTGRPYLGDLDPFLNQFGETPEDARRTFRFYARMEEAVSRTPPSEMTPAACNTLGPHRCARAAHISSACPDVDRGADSRLVRRRPLARHGPAPRFGRPA